MALTKISEGGVKDDAASQAKIADEAVDEARLQVSNAGSNGQFLQKQSGNTGGLTWATATTDVSGKANLTGAEFTGVVGLKGSSDQLKFYDADISNYVHVKSPTALTGNTTYTLPVDDGSSGQLLKTSGSGALSWTDPPASAPQIEATADGAITAGDTCVVNANGTVKKVTATYTEKTPVLGNYSTLGTGHNKEKIKVGFDSNRGQALFLYKSQNGNGARMHIGTIASGDLTLNTDEEVEASVSSIYGLAWSKTSAVGVAVYGKSSKIYAEAFTSDGSSLTFGSKFEVCDGSGGADITWDSAANKFLVVVGQSAENSSYDVADAYVLSVSGTTISSGSRVEVDTSNMYRYGCLAYDEDNNKHLWTYRDNADSGKLAARIITVSGTTPTVGSEAVSDTSSVGGSRPVYIGGGKFVVAYEKSSDLHARVITVSGTTPSFGTESSKIDDCNTNDYQHQIAITYDRTGKVFVGYLPGVWSAEFRILTIDTSANTISAISSETVIGTAKVISAYYDPDTQMHIFGGQKSDSHGFYRTAVTSDVSTNATTENYIGIAAGTVSSGATATIDVSGATNSSQSSLTAGQKYYVKKDGSLSTTADTPAVFAGTAIAATKLIVNDQQPIPSGAWELVSTTDSTGIHTIEYKGFSNAYAKYKLVIQDWSRTTSTATTEQSKVRANFYFDAASGNDGTLMESDYKYTRQIMLAPGAGTNPSCDGLTNQPRWELGGNQEAYSWSGELIFPMMQSGGFGTIPKIVTGEVTLNGYEDNVQKLGCFVNNTTAKTQHLTGIKIYIVSGVTPTAATRGKLSLYRLKR